MGLVLQTKRAWKLCPLKRQLNDRMEHTIMLNGIPIDVPNILPESGIEQMKRKNAYETVVEPDFCLIFPKTAL
jgi:hypothetical protein